MKTAEGIQSVKRAISIIELLSESSVPLSTIEISGMTGLNRNTAQGLINTLMSEEYVIRDKITGKYLISSKLYRLGCNFPYKLPIVRETDVMMKYLSTKYNLTLHFAILSVTDEVLIINKYLPLSIENTRSGFLLPFHASSLGKIFFAYQSTEKQKELLEKSNLRKYTINTITDKNYFQEEIKKTIKCGYAEDKGEYLDNTYCLGFPIFGENETIIAAFSLSGTQDELENEKEKIIPDCLQIAKNCSWSTQRNPIQ